MKTVIVGMSGGVDSSVAAWLLKEQGWNVEGLFMKNWDQDDNSDHCPAAIDLADAEAVCHQLQIPLHTVNFAQQYWDQVFKYFLEEYQKGRTPNPDVLCNKEIKFKLFLDYALKMGADYIATGHYARVEHSSSPKLQKAKDRNKDQTYFLHAVNPQALNKTLFPIGDYLKSEVRQLAHQLGLGTKDKKDSTGICFIGERKFKSFLKEYVLSKPGIIRATDGSVMGNHDGLMFYTLGQRQGLGIGGTKQSSDEPWYVVDKNIETNELMVAQGQHHAMLYSQGLICEAIHWIRDPIPEFPFTCYAKARYRQEEQACIIAAADHERHCVMFSTPQRAITPGQYVVFYQRNECLGGAIIHSVVR